MLSQFRLKHTMHEDCKQTCASVHCHNVLKPIIKLPTLGRCFWILCHDQFLGLSIPDSGGGYCIVASGYYDSVLYRCSAASRGALTSKNQPYRTMSSSKGHAADGSGFTWDRIDLRRKKSIKDLLKKKKKEWPSNFMHLDEKHLRKIYSQCSISNL